ncbi:MAG: M23 family metallopeptidase [Alphaproteobacteria bacterium]|nr:M23 family metallopeptidase [Alphaproteobacteria bacterium]MBV8413488.1 M23 family metallopeptidase [Alphaproteobacteria bacterium]
MLMTTRQAANRGRPIRLCLAASLVTLSSLLMPAASARVRVPDYGFIDRKMENRGGHGLQGPLEHPQADSPKQESPQAMTQACHGWQAANPFAAFAGFAANTRGDASLPFTEVKLLGLAGSSASSGETVSYRQLQSLLDDASAPTNIVEVAEGITHDGVACPLYVSVGSDEQKHTFWRFAPQDEPEGWFDEEGRRLGAILVQPKPGSRISSTFGPRRYYGRLTGGGFHDGIDFESRVGEPVYAAADGIIEHEGWYFEYGLTIKIRHAAQFTTLYAHLSRFAPGAPLGASVRKGDLIGYVGMTGRSTGAHLHFSAIANGRFVDPAPYLRDRSTLGGAALAAFRAWQTEVEAAVGASRHQPLPLPQEADWTTRT